MQYRRMLGYRDMGCFCGLGMANPASTACVAAGGSSGSDGTCTFNDGSTCNEWAFFRGECKPGENKSSLYTTVLGFVAVTALIAWASTR